METTEERTDWWQLTPAQISRLDVLVRGEDTEAVCIASGQDPDLWFPPERDEGPISEQGRKASQERAQRVCVSQTLGTCPVQGACLLLALNRGDQYGIFAGTPGWELAKLRKDADALEARLSGLRDDAGVIEKQRARFEAEQAELEEQRAREDNGSLAA